ncbi:MAG: phage portal protein [Candidatus Nanopelagicales bacterium]
MTFVASSGKITSLSRPAYSRPSGVRLSSQFSASYAEIFRTQPQVRTVVQFLGRNIAQLKLHAFERVSDTDRRKLTNEPLARMLARPNPRMTRYKLFQALVNDLGIYDAAYWLKVRSGDQLSLVRIPPHVVEVRSSNWLEVDAFRVRGSRGFQDFGPDEIIYFHGYNPLDPLTGLSPMETLRQLLAEEFESGQYRSQLWRNGARFPGVIERPKDAPVWSDTARDRFKSDWQGLYTGAGAAAGGTPVLEDGMSYKAGGITPAEAQYLETRKLTRAEVAAAYFIPPPMVGVLDNATFSNISEQHKQLYQDTLGPWLTDIQEELMLQLLPEFEGTESVYLEYNIQEKLRGSFEERAASMGSAVGAPYMTRNEARAMENLPEVEGGNELVTPLNVLTGGLASPRDTAPKSGVKAITAEVEETESMESVLVEFFARQEKSVLSALGVKSDGWWDEDRWNDELADDLLAVAQSVVAQAGKSAAGDLSLDPADFDTDRTVEWLRSLNKRVASQINAATKRQIDAVLEEAGDVVDVFTTAKEDRAPEAAITLGTTLVGFAVIEAARQLAPKQTVKTWVVTSRNPRASHAAMDGETVPIEEPFSNGAMWPADAIALDVDEVAGCQCAVDISLVEE